MVTDVVQDGEGSRKTIRFVFKDHNDTCSCAAATGEMGRL